MRERIRFEILLLGEDMEVPLACPVGVVSSVSTRVMDYSCEKDEVKHILDVLHLGRINGILQLVCLHKI